MSKSTKISVPKEVGDQVIISYAGLAPVTYKITDGHATVLNEDVNKFLDAVPNSEVEGSKSDAGTAGDGK